MLNVSDFLPGGKKFGKPGTLLPVVIAVVLVGTGLRTLGLPAGLSLALGLGTVMLVGLFISAQRQQPD